MSHLPESLSLWDRLFNRYRREIDQRGTMVWTSGFSGGKRDYPYVDYRVIDRVTGSETVERDWLNGPPPSL